LPAGNDDAIQAALENSIEVGTEPGAIFNGAHFDATVPRL